VFERYPLGGAASLRGYDEETFRVDHYLLSRLEWRWYLASPRQRVYAFWDHAWAETRRATLDGGVEWDTLQKDGIGFGLQLETAAGLAGIDYGLEPGRPPLEGKIHLRLVSNF
jgi:hemolysin activation/secretion protein